MRVVGSIVTVDGAIAVNRITKKSTKRLRHFVVTGHDKRGKPALYPPLRVRGPYRTIMKKPKKNARVRLIADPREPTAIKPKIADDGLGSVVVTWDYGEHQQLKQ